MGNHKVIPETWRGKGSAAPLAKALRDIGGVMNNVQGLNGIYAYVRGGRLVVEGQAIGIDFSSFCFGFRISGAKVTIIGGDWPIGEADPLELADTDVTISQEGQYVGLQVDTVAKTIEVIGPSVNKAFFKPDGQKFRTWLHRFHFINGKASFWPPSKLGSLFMPSTFGATP